MFDPTTQNGVYPIAYTLTLLVTVRQRAGKNGPDFGVQGCGRLPGRPARRPSGATKGGR
jgi:hypothetical protein